LNILQEKVFFPFYDINQVSLNFFVPADQTGILRNVQILKISTKNPQNFWIFFDPDNV